MEGKRGLHGTTNLPQNCIKLKWTTSILTGFMQDNRIIRPSRYPVCLPMNHLPEQKTIGSSSGDVKPDRRYQNLATTILSIPIARAALGYMTNVQGRSNSFM